MNLYGGLNEMAFFSSLTFGRLSFQYFSKLRSQTKNQAATSTDIFENLSKAKSSLVLASKPLACLSSGPTTTLKEDDAQEIVVVKEILALIDVESLGVVPSSELLFSRYASRWSDRNVEEILKLLSFQPSSLTDGAAHGSGSSSSSTRMDLLRKYSSKELLESEKFVKSLKENALRCVEAISCLTQQVQFDGFLFDVEKTRLHFVTKFVDFLSNDEQMHPVELYNSWDTHACLKSIGSLATKVVADVILAEKAQLQELVKGLTGDIGQGAKDDWLE